MKKQNNNDTFEVRNKRIENRFTIDNLFVDEYMFRIGKTPADCHRISAIYMILCRFSNNDTGEAFPTQHQMKHLLQYKSQGNITSYIKPLADWNIISIRSEESDKNDGSFHSIYTLLDKSVWIEV